MDDTYIEAMVDGYISCALWAGLDITRCGCGVEVKNGKCDNERCLNFGQEPSSNAPLEPATTPTTWPTRRAPPSNGSAGSSPTRTRPT